MVMGVETKSICIQNMPKETLDKLHMMKRMFDVRSIREVIEIMLDIVERTCDVEEVACKFKSGEYRPQITSIPWRLPNDYKEGKAKPFREYALGEKKR